MWSVVTWDRIPTAIHVEPFDKLRMNFGPRAEVGTCSRCDWSLDFARDERIKIR
jgi:hypothetical protein